MDRNSVENQLQALVGNSGNSDVDLSVQVDVNTKIIAYGMLCSLYAKGEISESELERAISKLDSLVERDENKKKQSKQTNRLENPYPIWSRKWI